jgi:hypothetical protein
MPVKRVFVSVTSDKSLDARRKSLKAAILAELRSRGFEPQLFWESGIAETLAWSFENVDRVMRQCVGAVVIGFPRWIEATEDTERGHVGEYNHYEGAVALTHRLPVLLLAEIGTEDRGIVWKGGGKHITYVPRDADDQWVRSPEFQKRLDSWKLEVTGRKDVFLGYCSQNKLLASHIENVLGRAGATVLNYAMDFRSGVSILEEIERARSTCSCGIFIFGENDPLEGKDGNAAPRDNVVFEAGYFMSSKGPNRCLIIRLDDAKMPADLGGAIYLQIKNSEVESIEKRLERFLEQNL